MSPPGKVPRKENLGLQCEWGSCSFVCSAMEDFFEHVTEHLQQHMRGSKEEEEEEDPLGKGTGKLKLRWKLRLREKEGSWGNRFIFLIMLSSSFIKHCRVISREFSQPGCKECLPLEAICDFVCICVCGHMHAMAQVWGS